MSKPNRQSARLTDLKAIRRDLNILLELMTDPSSLDRLRGGKTLDDLRMEEAARLAHETGDYSHITQCLNEKHAREGTN